MRTALILVAVAINAVGESLAAQAGGASDSTIVVHGILQVGEFFGPPNYGEDPATDRLERTFYLQLPAPMSYQASAAPLGREAFFVQLVVLDSALRSSMRRLVGRRVKVRGVLFPAETGHHRTEVLLSVSQAVATERWEW